MIRGRKYNVLQWIGDVEAAVERQPYWLKRVRCLPAGEASPPPYALAVGVHAIATGR